MIPGLDFNCAEKSGQKTENVGVIVGSVVGGILFVFLASLAAFFCEYLAIILIELVLVYRRKTRGAQDLPMSSTEDTEIRNVQVQELIGKGAFGVVHKAMWRGVAVAIKTIVDNEAEFEKEVHFLSKLKHPSILVNSNQVCRLM